MTDALQVLAAALTGGAACPNAFRLVALAARMLGAEEEAHAALIAALAAARQAGDLVGAVDVIRRLETMSADTAEAWAAIEEDLEALGFKDRPDDGVTVDRAALGDIPVGSDEELLTRCVERALVVESAGGRVPFRPVPLIDALPSGAAGPILRALQLRVVRHKQPVADVTLGAVGWVVSGLVAFDDRTHTPPAGSLLLAPSSVRAFGVLRILTLPAARWSELRATGAIAQVLDAFPRRQRLGQALAGSDFFRALSPASRALFLASAAGVVLDGDVVIRRGQPVAGLFVAVSGAIAVRDPGTPGEEVARLEPGDVFGEVDVVFERGASHDVVAIGAAEVCFLPAAGARALLEADPDARQYLVHLGLQRTGDTPAAGAATTGAQASSGA